MYEHIIRRVEHATLTPLVIAATDSWQEKPIPFTTDLFPFSQWCGRIPTAPHYTVYAVYYHSHCCAQATITSEG